MATILIVADDAALTAAMAGVLTRSGYEVFGAPSGKEAIRKVSRRRFDLILLDLDLGREAELQLGSREVLYTIRAMANALTTPILAVAADDDPVLDELRGVIVGHLPKPLDTAALEDVVAHLLLEAGPADGRVAVDLDRSLVYEALSELVRDARDAEQY